MKARLDWRPFDAAATPDRRVVLGWCPEDLCAYSVYRDGDIWRVAGGQGAVLDRTITLVAEIPVP